MDSSTVASDLSGMFRIAVLGALTLGAAALMPHPAEALTAKQCKLVAETAKMAFEATGPQNLSPDFKDSFGNFIGPRDRCDGAPDIKRVTDGDIATYSVIRVMLVSVPPKSRIDLETELQKLAAARKSAQAVPK
jgi:hypothetical protein